jgi:hypothetical protein
MLARTTGECVSGRSKGGHPGPGELCGPCADAGLEAFAAQPAAVAVDDEDRAERQPPELGLECRADGNRAALLRRSCRGRCSAVSERQRAPQRCRYRCAVDGPCASNARVGCPAAGSRVGRDAGVRLQPQHVPARAWMRASPHRMRVSVGADRVRRSCSPGVSEAAIRRVMCPARQMRRGAAFRGAPGCR